MDENDLVFTNQYIPLPELNDEIDNKNEQFKKFYEEESRIRDINKINRDIIENNTNNDTDPFDLLNTNKYDNNREINNDDVKERNIKEQVSYISIDSRDRDKLIYPKPNNFKIFLGKTFRQVKKIKLVKIEFPNTDAVINSTNNNIYWRNKEDIIHDHIDDITQTYPIYSVNLRIGSYISTTLSNEMTKKFSLIKRENGDGNFHSFLVDLDIDTDIVSITSLEFEQIGNNNVSVTAGSNTIRITVSNGNIYSVGELVYIHGIKSVGGIASSYLNGFHTIQSITGDEIIYEITIKAAEITIGGGNTIEVGKLAPFQFLFGENKNTIASNLGYPLENSSQRVVSYIKEMKKYIQVKIILTTKHNLKNDQIYNTNQQVSIENTGTDIDGSPKLITQIIDEYTLLISVDNKINRKIFNTGTVTYNSVVYYIAVMYDNEINTVKIRTFSTNNLDLNDIGRNIVLYETTSIPTFNDPTYIYNVLSPTDFLIPGEILDQVEEGPYYDEGKKYGYFGYHNGLTTHTITITGITTGDTTTITCIDHGLNIGDKIKFYNIETSPSILNTDYGIFTVYNIVDDDNFIIDFKTESYKEDDILNGNAYIGLQKITMYMPYHKFNTIVSITRIDNNTIEINTKLDHGLETGDNIRIMETNSYPVIDGYYKDINVIDDDTFRISQTKVGTLEIGSLTSGTYGIIGMSNRFYLYGVTSLGGISSNALNNVLHNVSNVIDENRFEFICNEFASKRENGGGENVYISSLNHGFAGTQQNVKNAVLNRSINLEGENYSFITCPQLGTMLNTGDVKDIFARITLDQSPGSMVFDFLSNPKIFNPSPLAELNELEFSVSNYNNTLYEFNDLDYSMTLELTEIVDIFEDANFNSRTGLYN